jgi:hypothetical protein
MPVKLSGLSHRQLRRYQNYFLEVQADHDPGLPPHEATVTSERLTLLRSELDQRQDNRRHTQTQALAVVAILVAIAGLILARCDGDSRTPTPQQDHSSPAAPTAQPASPPRD